jgi:hypothetical protein
MGLGAYAKLALLALQLALSLIKWVEREKLRDQAERDLFNEQQEAIRADIAKADAARADVRAAAERDPSRLRDDDGHRRD